MLPSPASKRKNIALHHDFRDTRRPCETGGANATKTLANKFTHAQSKKSHQDLGAGHGANGYHARIRRGIADCGEQWLPGEIQSPFTVNVHHAMPLAMVPSDVDGDLPTLTKTELAELAELLFEHIGLNKREA